MVTYLKTRGYACGGTHSHSHTHTHTHTHIYIYIRLLVQRPGATCAET